MPLNIPYWLISRGSGRAGRFKDAAAGRGRRAIISGFPACRNFLSGIPVRELCHGRLRMIKAGRFWQRWRGVFQQVSKKGSVKMGRCRNETDSRFEIKVRLAELNRLDRQLEKRNERFRSLQEDAIAARIENITRLLNSICRSAPRAISRSHVAAPTWRSRRRPRGGHVSQLRWPSYP
jgi:hypothetical protein